MPTITSQEQYDELQKALEEARRQVQENLSNVDKLAGGDLMDRMRADAERKLAELEAGVRRDYYDFLGGSFEDVPQSAETQERAQALGDLRVREIDRGMYGATRASAANYSRRGIGGSGYAAAAQSQAVQAAHAERARARASALDQATAEGQRGIMGRAALSGKGDPFLAQMLSAAEQRYSTALQNSAASRAAWDNFLRDQVIGGAIEGLGYAMGGGSAGAASVGTGPYDYDPEELLNYGGYT
jgi:hypothetical protein